MRLLGQTIAPPADPVAADVNAALQWIRVVSRLDQALLPGLISQARQRVETHTGRLWWRAADPGARAVVSDVEIERGDDRAPIAPGLHDLVDATATLQTWTEADGYAAAAAPTIWPDWTWKPTASGFYRLTASITPAETLPAGVTEAVQRLVASAYDNRRASTGQDAGPSLAGLMLRSGAAACLRPFRRIPA